MKSIEKIDPLTGERFIALRSNQVFATEENRIRFNNEKAKEIRIEKSFVDKPLHKNLLILTELMEGKLESIFHEQFLNGKGYSLNVMTHYEEYEGKSCRAIYNYLIMRIDSENIKIVKK